MEKRYLIIKGFSCHFDGFGLMTFYVLIVVSVFVRPNSRTTLSKDSFPLMKRSGTFTFFHHPHTVEQHSGSPLLDSL